MISVGIHACTSYNYTTQIYLQFLGIFVYWKNLREVKRELGMERSVMEWMMLMMYICSHGQGLLLVPLMYVLYTFLFCFFILVGRGVITVSRCCLPSIHSFLKSIDGSEVLHFILF